MDENLHNAKELLRKYREGSCTPDEKAWVENWYAQLNDTPTDLSDTELSDDLSSLKAKLEHIPQRTPLKRTLLSLAAAAIVLLSAGLIIYRYQQPSPPVNILTSKYGGDVLPGGNRATLTLDNGQVYRLDSTKQAIMADEERLVYEDGSSLTHLSETRYATLRTPKGGQYQLTLPDGSRIWLNAASSIKYPVHFSGNGRHVEMSGEAYFEIAHNANRPFTVTTADQSVTVLGTSFNINAYEDETFTATTLITGSVRVNSIANKETKTLQPGEQAILENGELTTYQVDANDFTVWKSGVITLHYAKLPAIFRQIERWYDVTFVVNEKLPEDDLYGELQRNANLSEVLAALEINTGMKFRIEGRRVIVGR